MGSEGYVEIAGLLLRLGLRYAEQRAGRKLEAMTPAEVLAELRGMEIRPVDELLPEPREAEPTGEEGDD